MDGWVGVEEMSGIDGWSVGRLISAGLLVQEVVESDGQYRTHTAGTS